MKYVLEQNSKQYEFMGGKATALAKMGQAIDNIPKWFVVSHEGFDKKEKNIKEEAIKEVEEFLQTINSDITVAVMGCAVNGPGEASNADIGIAGGIKEGLLFKKGKIIRKIPQENIVNELKEEILKMIEG